MKNLLSLISISSLTSLAKASNKYFFSNGPEDENINDSYNYMMGSAGPSSNGTPRISLFHGTNNQHSNCINCGSNQSPCSAPSQPRLLTHNTPYNQNTLPHFLQPGCFINPNQSNMDFDGTRRFVRSNTPSGIANSQYPFSFGLFGNVSSNFANPTAIRQPHTSTTFPYQAYTVNIDVLKVIFKNCTDDRRIITLGKALNKFIYQNERSDLIPLLLTYIKMSTNDLMDLEDKQSKNNHYRSSGILKITTRDNYVILKNICDDNDLFVDSEVYNLANEISKVNVDSFYVSMLFFAKKFSGRAATFEVMMDIFRPYGFNRNDSSSRNIISRWMSVYEYITKYFSW